MKTIKRFFLGCLLAGASVLVTAEAQVLTNRATELRAAPDDSAMIIKTLADRTPVQSLERKGAWTRVKIDRDTGWVRMIHLRGGAVVEESTSGGNSFLSGFSRLLGGDSGRGTQRAQSATVGIRGFSKEDVAKAEFNPAEFEKLKRYQTNDADAQQLALQGRLTFRSVAYLAQDAVESANAKGAKK